MRTICALVVDEGAGAAEDFARRGAANFEPGFLQHPEGRARMRSTCSAVKTSSGGHGTSSRGSGASVGPVERGVRRVSAAARGRNDFTHGLIRLC